MNVIDAIAPTSAGAPRQDRRPKTAGKGFVLHTAGAQIDEAHPGFFTRLLNALIDPNILPLLFLAGLAGIGFEIFHPGVVLPGALGAVALVTALFGFSVLPISWAGLALLLLGAALLVIGRARGQPRRAHGRGPDQPRRRLADALPQRARAVPPRQRAADHRRSPSCSAASGPSRSTKAVQVRRSPVRGRAADDRRRGRRGAPRRPGLRERRALAARSADGERTLRPGPQRPRRAASSPSSCWKSVPFPAE